MSQLAPNSARPTSSGLIWSSTRFYWRTSLAIALGVAIATSVIIGALLVGDSMRGSLKSLTVERLGKVQSVVAPGGFFDAEAASKTLGVEPNELATLILFDRAVIEATDNNGQDEGQTPGKANVRRTGAVQTIGCDDSFWAMDTSDVAPTATLDDDSIILTRTVAVDLGVEVGDQVTVRLPNEQAVPADSPLGRRDAQTEGIPRLTVVEILPDRGLARFSLSPAQATPRNVFLSRELIASVLERDGKANIALASVPINADQLSVSLEDLGLKLNRETASFDDQTVFDYYSVTSDRLLVDSIAVDAITQALSTGRVTPAMTYLANAIERLDESGTITHTVPYSTITAIDSSDALPLNYASPDDMENDDVADLVPLAINAWTAAQLEAEIGTKVRVAYYEPEVENGNEIEKYFPAVVTDIVPLTEPAKPYRRRREAVFEQPPTPYNDPNLTPSVPGVTDQDSISDWDLPFELTREISNEDDRYWNNYRLTPKAFLPLETGRKLFGSRFGDTTNLRIAPEAVESREQLETLILDATRPLQSDLGWHVRSLRDSQLAASSGTTPFDGLFLALSMFVILAAVMLIAMLFRLGLIGRRKQVGTLMAIGWQRGQVFRLILGEGAIIALIGTLLGIVGGVAYAVSVLAALRTFWVGAVTVPFLTFHASPMSLIIGSLVGMLLGLATIGWSLRTMLRNQTISLLRGRDASEQVRSSVGADSRPNPWPRRFTIGLFVAAIGTACFGAVSGGQTAAGAFVGGGMLMLVAALLLIFQRLRRGSAGAGSTNTTAAAGFSLSRLAISNSTRSPLRSTLTIGLMSVASFLIVAITAFRLQPTDEGTGGFDLIADTAQPLYEDLSDADVRAGLLGPDANLLDDCSLVAMRVRSGQDASCNNLYQATEPTVLGIPDRASDQLNQFRFYAGRSETGADGKELTPWHQLSRVAAGTADDPIPMIVDQNTAMWSLKMLKGVGERKEFLYDNQALTFEVVGLLENSLLQGRLMIGETNFETTFPAISGYSMVLIDTPDGAQDAVAETLETRLGDIGFDAADAGVVLSGMMAVQNTYLRTFQSLGGLGLLLGTVGLAIAQVRNVLERRSELAVMRAIGFTRGRLAKMVMGETASLLLLGIGCGVLCAAISVLPYAISSGIAPPVIEPILLVLGIVVFGLLAGFIAAWQVVRMELLDSLRQS